MLAQIAALRTAPTPDLKRQWRQLFGSEPPPFSRPYLQSRLAFRIQELAFGGLKPETVARLESLGERLDGGKPRSAASAPMIGRSPARGWSANTRASSTS